MTYLIDTQAIIWFLEGNPRLSAAARQAISDSHNTAWVSIASIWEIAIKISIGKLDLAQPLQEMLARMSLENINLLPIEPNHALRILSLEHFHKDPFDRIIIAQAAVEGLEIISSDEVFSAYPVRVFW